jgi:acetyl esterase/lipase
MNDEAKSMADLVNAPVVFELPGMQDVQVLSDLRYSSEEDPNLRMDVYAPPARKNGERLPLVLMIHGGAGAQLRAKDWGVFQSWGRLFAAAGMVAVTFTHRLAPPPNSLLVEAAADVHQALQFARAHANEWNADADRICVAAWSAGGPLLTALMREKPAYLRGLLAFYALLDLQHYAAGADPGVLAFLKAFSPIATLQENGGGAAVPLFIARAGLDQVPLLNDALDRFVAAALASNAPVTLMNHPAGVHGFDNQTNDARSREIVQAAIAFASRLTVDGTPCRQISS